MLQLRRLITVDLETTYGTDPVPTVADAVRVNDLNITVPGEKKVRGNVGGSLSPQSHIIGQKYVEIAFTVFGSGNGALGVAPEMGKLLRACGYGETVNASTSVVYDPISTGFESVTIYANMDGIVHKATGCRGNVEVIFEAGEFVKFNFSMVGQYAIPTDEALPSGTFITTIPPIVASSSLVIGAFSTAVVAAIQASLNNTVVRVKDTNNVKGRVDITGREPAGSFDPEAVIEATNDFWADWENSVAQNTSLTAGSTAGNQITLAMPSLVYDVIGWGDRDGNRIYDIPFTPTLSTGDDEMVLTFD